MSDTDLVVLPLLGRVKEEEPEIKQVKRHHDTGIALKLPPQPTHLGSVADALYHKKGLGSGPLGTELKVLPQQSGIIHIMQVEEIHGLTGIEEQLVEAGGVPEVHPLLGRREIETGRGGTTHTKGIRRLYEVDQPIKQALHLERLSAAAFR